MDDQWLAGGPAQRGGALVGHTHDRDRRRDAATLYRVSLNDFDIGCRFEPIDQCLSGHARCRGRDHVMAVAYARRPSPPPARPGTGVGCRWGGPPPPFYLTDTEARSAETTPPRPT